MSAQRSPLFLFGAYQTSDQKRDLPNKLEVTIEASDNIVTEQVVPNNFGYNTLDLLSEDALEMIFGMLPPSYVFVAPVNKIVPYGGACSTDLSNTYPPRPI